MNDIVIKSGEHELRIRHGGERLVLYVINASSRKFMEEHAVWLSEGETPEQWLSKLAESHPETEPMWIGQADLYFGDYRSCHFGAYGFTRGQIREAIKAALQSENPRLIFRAEDGQRYEWVDGDFRETWDPKHIEDAYKYLRGPKE